MTLIYLAGKYSVGDREVNIQAVYDMAVRLWDAGFAVLSPVLNSARMEEHCKVADYEDFLAGDLRMVQNCDAILFLPGWQDSPGARIEHIVAKAYDLPVFYSFEALTRHPLGVTAFEVEMEPMS